MWPLLLLLGTAPPPDYTTAIKPLLAARCRACHGALTQKGGLRTDTAAFLIEGGNTGTSVIPGNSAESSLVRRIRKLDGKQRMPPEHEGEEVGQADIDLIVRWIDSGAKAPTNEIPEADPSQHWAFQPPKKSGPLSGNPVDAILAKARRKIGVNPASRAEDGLLWRRLYLDLTGLPPTEAELSQPATPENFARVAEKLLASDAHAERWARHFMDIWRYSDWWGLGAEVRNSQKHIWHWRDWIIDSVRSDKPYDQMIREMFAADELYPNDREKLRATGLLVRPYFLFNRNTWMEDAIEHLGKGFLGMTVNCARCHDHKYDPISQVDYYRFRAIFEPYQVRSDLVGKELNPEMDALPRVFDCNLDVKTHRFIRGNEAQPDTSRVMEPGVPRIFGKIPFDPKRISLPPEAHQPGLNPDLIKAQKDRLNGLILEKQKALDADKILLVSAPKTPTAPKEGKLLVRGFADTKLWMVQSGTWKLSADSASQIDTKAMRTEVHYTGPQISDFELRAKIRITGGDPYRSVGFAFDASDGNENLIYASAHAPGPKVQFAPLRNAVASYPAEGLVSKPVTLNKDFTLRIRVQGRTLLVDYDGSQILVYTLPDDRKKGLLKLITYTATTQVSDFELRELAPGTVLDPKAKSPETLAKNIRAHESGLLALKTELASIDTLVEAMRDLAEANPLTEAKAKAAAKAQAEVAHLGAIAELQSLQAQNSGVDKIKAQEAKVAELAKKLTNPGKSFKPLLGSYKAKENNQESQESVDKPFPRESTGRRTALAKWMTDKAHPLTARVIVNHVWARHMGQPLVPSVFDFGRKGKAPLNQELLDWLASDLMEKGYSLRHLHRLIVTSEAYALGADPAPDHPGWKLDPENKTFWHKTPQRLESESVRDGLLHLAGSLDTKVGGPTIPTADTQATRRSLYFFHSHNEDQRFLAQFDSPNVLDCYRREESIVPQQALTLFNSKISRELSQKIAQQIAPKESPAKENPGGSQNDAAFVDKAFRILLGQTPTPAEREACVIAMQAWTRENPKDPARARTNLVHTLINHNDFITLR